MTPNTQTFIYLVLAVASFAVMRLCLAYEKKSRKWYSDRAAIFASGFFCALGCAAAMAVVVRLA